MHLCIDWKQQCALAVYVGLASLSILNVCASATVQHYVYDSDSPDVSGWEQIVTSVAVLIAAHTILLLATALHGTPTLAPFDYLLWLMRGTASVFFAASVLRFVKFSQFEP